MDPFLSEDSGPTVVVVNLRYVQKIRTCEIALELHRVGGFPHQIEFVDDGLFVFRDDFKGSQPLAGFPVGVCQFGQRVQDVEVPIYQRPNARAQQLDDNLRAILQRCSVNLCDRGSGEGLAVETGEHIVDGFAIDALENLSRFVGGKRRNPILQHREFIGDVRRQ